MKLPQRASDLVSNGVILRAVDKIVRSARSIAAQKRAGKSAKAIVLSPVRETNKTVIVDISFNTKIAPEAPAYEYGSGLHGKNPRFIEIPAGKTSPLLVFQGTNQFEGQTIFTPLVSYHPGVKARPFLAPAVKKHRAELKEAVAQEVGKNLRIYLNRMKTKV